MAPLNTIVLPDVNTIVFANTQMIVKNSSMKLGHRIITARTYANLTQEELAYAVGCSIDLIRKLERNERPTTTFIVRIARACKVSADWLEDETGPMIPNGEYVSDPDLITLLRLAKSFSTSERLLAIEEVEKVGKIAAQIRAEYKSKDRNQ